MTKENINQENSRLYEIGFHIVSTVAPDKVADEFEIIKVTHWVCTLPIKK